MAITVLMDDARRAVALVQSPVVAYSPPRINSGGPAVGTETADDWEVRKVYPLHPPFCSLRQERAASARSTLAPPMGREW